MSSAARSFQRPSSVCRLTAGGPGEVVGLVQTSELYYYFFFSVVLNFFSNSNFQNSN